MLRVVAGTYKGRRLRTPPGRGTRPTADRVREALFSILGDLDGDNVADLFAGSGALGIEALSRGARHVTFVERDPRAAATIEGNLERLGEVQSVVVRDALAWLRERVGHEWFDVVLLDPPYDSAADLAGRLTELLPPTLTRDGVIVTESHTRNPLILDLPLWTERTYGDTRIAIHHGS
jgi:16S rRNA (guanine966-N2)-methyltransferase